MLLNGKRELARHFRDWKWVMKGDLLYVTEFGRRCPAFDNINGRRIEIKCKDGVWKCPSVLLPKVSELKFTTVRQAEDAWETLEKDHEDIGRGYALIVLLKSPLMETLRYIRNSDIVYDVTTYLGHPTAKSIVSKMLGEHCNDIGLVMDIIQDYRGWQRYDEKYMLRPANGRGFIRCDIYMEPFMKDHVERELFARCGYDWELDCHNNWHYRYYIERR